MGQKNSDASTRSVALQDISPPNEVTTSVVTGVTTKRQSLSDIFTISAAGVALISDAYFSNIMTMTNVLLSKEYPNEYTSAVKTRVSNSLLVGAVFGQIAVGLTCDYLGRKFAIVVTTAMLVVGGILATASSGASVEGMFWMMTVARGIIGFGAGGEFSASSTAASESANARFLQHRGPVFILITTFPLSMGAPLAASIFLIVFKACHEANYTTVWRICFGLGCLIPISIFYFRIKMLNSTLYRQNAIKRSVPYKLVLKYYWKSLFGTCVVWFLYDFVIFPNAVFSGTIIASVIPKNGDTVLKTGEWNLLLGALGLPGVFLGAWLCDRLGRKNTMILGFSGYLVFGLTIGLAYSKITKITPLFIVFYGLMQSSGNMGPGDMLGLIAAETFATSVRGTCYGIVAAVGKAGAAIGTEVFTPIQERWGIQWIFVVTAIVGVLGIVVTYFFVEDLTGEDLAEKDRRFKDFLMANGWVGEMGEEGWKGVVDGGSGTVVGSEVEVEEGVVNGVVVGGEKL